jgi:hypothetical protein
LKRETLKRKLNSVVERQALRNAVSVGGVHHGGFAESAAAFGAFRLAEVATPGSAPQNFAARCDFESFGHGLLGLYSFGASHIISCLSKKRARNIGKAAA